MNKETLQTLYYFVLEPNNKKLCGKNTSIEVITQCLNTGDTKKAEDEFVKFPTLISYLETIAEINKLSTFDDKVINCYLFGNNLIEKVKPNHFNILLNKLADHGVIDRKLIKYVKKPKFFIPTHNFHAIYINNPSTYEECGVILNQQKEKAVATHWNQVIKELTEDEARNLSYWTEEIKKLVG